MNIRNGSRKKQEGEQTPDYEVYELRHAGNPIQVCWDFEEYTHEESNETDYKYKFVNIKELNEEQLTSAGVPQEIINQII